MVSRTPLVVGLWLLLAAAPAAADEIRMKNGEVLHGRIAKEEKGAVVIETAGGRVRRRVKDIAERVEAEPPQAALARQEAMLSAGDADGRVRAARFAWSRRLDDDATRLAEAALALEAAHEGAHRLLGHVPTAEGWTQGLRAPWGARGGVGRRWGRKVGAGTRRALDWLAEHQDTHGLVDADGFDRHCPEEDRCDGKGGGHHGERMPCAFDGVATGLAVTAWSLGGSTPTSGPHRESLAKALPLCVRIARSTPSAFDAVWNHVYATVAVADVAALTRDPDLFDALVEAVGHLERRQLADGGWSYVFGIGDVPTTAAVLLALGSAAQAGVGVDAARVERALAFLDARVEASTGRVEYHDGAERKGYTPTTANAAAALAARAAVGRLGGAPHVSKMVASVTRKKPKWKIEFKEVKTRGGRTVRAQVGNLYPYAWFLAAWGLERRGGSAWKSWGGGLRKALLAGQERDGHRKGSWAPLGTYSLSGGRTVVTAMAAIMLQAAVRYPAR